MPIEERPEATLKPRHPGSGADGPLPDHVSEQAKAAFSQKADGELAVLVHDSLVDGEGTPEKHLLRFESRRFHIDVDVSVTPADAVLGGRVRPSVAGRFALLIDGADRSIDHDSSDGTFRFAPVGHGLLRLSFSPRSGPTTRTDWFRV